MPKVVPLSNLTPGDLKKTSEVPFRDREQIELFRRVVGKFLFVGIDRAGLQFTVKELSRGMSHPSAGDPIKLKKAGRYFAGKRDALTVLEPLPPDIGPLQVIVKSDSDWAKDPTERRSTSGGAVSVYGVPLLSYSRTQQCISLSIAEAELYALSTAVTEAKGIASVLSELGEMHLLWQCAMLLLRFPSQKD